MDPSFLNIHSYTKESRLLDSNETVTTWFTIISIINYLVIGVYDFLINKYSLFTLQIHDN